MQAAAAAAAHGAGDASLYGIQLTVRPGDGGPEDLAVGTARPGVAMTADTLLLWLSVSKPVVAVCVAMLWERELLGLDEPVWHHLPELRRPPLDQLTVRHLLTHTAGFDDDPPPGAMALEWDEAVTLACRSRLEDGWLPGRMAKYSTWTGFLLLAEMVRRVDGRAFSVFAREEVFRPLGMDDCGFSWPEHDLPDPSRLADLSYPTARGPLPDPVLNDRGLLVRCWPALGLRGPASQVARFYCSLLPDPGELPPLLRRPTIEAITSRHHVGIRYHRFLKDVCVGLGTLVGAEMFGPYCSSRTFGGRGHGSSVAFADPVHNLVVVAGWTMLLQDDTKHGSRVKALSGAVYEDLGLNVRVRRAVAAAPATPSPDRTGGGGGVEHDGRAQGDGPLLDALRGRSDAEMASIVSGAGGPDALLDPVRTALAEAIRPSAVQPAVVGLALRWPDGERHSTIRITPGVAPTVVAGDAGDAELTIGSTGFDMIRLLARELDIKEALTTGRLRIDGELAVISAWQRMFGGSVFAMGLS